MFVSEKISAGFHGYSENQLIIIWPKIDNTEFGFSMAFMDVKMIVQVVLFHFRSELVI